MTRSRSPLVLLPLFTLSLVAADTRQPEVKLVTPKPGEPAVVEVTGLQKELVAAVAAAKLTADDWETVCRLTVDDGKPAIAKVASRTVRGLKVTTVDTSGTYSGMGGPMATSPTSVPNYRLLGAIVEAPGGTVFFKFTDNGNSRSAVHFVSVAEIKHQWFFAGFALSNCSDSGLKILYCYGLPFPFAF